MTADGAPRDITENAVLGGRLHLRQPKRGHRVGHDAILLAAATPAKRGQHAVELGAGIGAAGLALASRVAGLMVTLVEIDPTLAALARENAVENGLGERVTALVLDATAPARAFTAAGLGPGCAQHVLMNPPFNDPRRLRASPDAQRRRAHAAPAEELTLWVASAHRLLADGGTLTLIWRADGLGHVLAALEKFGGIDVIPVHPRAEAPAGRILVRAVKGSRGPMMLLPGLILHEPDGRPSAAAEAVLRDGAALPSTIRR